MAVSALLCSLLATGLHLASGMAIPPPPADNCPHEPLDGRWLSLSDLESVCAGAQEPRAFRKWPGCEDVFEELKISSAHMEQTDEKLEDPPICITKTQRFAIDNDGQVLYYNQKTCVPPADTEQVHSKVVVRPSCAARAWTEDKHKHRFSCVNRPMVDSVAKKDSVSVLVCGSVQCVAVRCED